MSVVHGLLSYIDLILLLSMLAIWIARRLGLGLSVQRGGIIVIAVLALTPIEDLYLFMYSRALLGDLSMTSKVFMVAWLMYRLGGPTLTNMKEIRFTIFTVALIGIVFYPMALGLTGTDPYALGFSASVLIIWNIVGVLYGVRHNYLIMAIGLLLGLWGYLFGIMESDNLFDYLFDPLLFLYAVIFSCVTLLKNRKTTKTAEQA